jgi:hypothetical protein
MYMFISIVLCLFTIILAGAFGFFLARVERDHYSFPVYNCENQCVGYILKKYNKQWVPILACDKSIIGYMFANKQLEQSLSQIRKEGSC